MENTQHKGINSRRPLAAIRPYTFSLAPYVLNLTQRADMAYGMKHGVAASKYVLLVKWLHRGALSRQTCAIEGGDLLPSSLKSFAHPFGLALYDRASLAYTVMLAPDL